MTSIIDAPEYELAPPTTGWRLFLTLADGALRPGRAWHNPAYRRKFILRSLLAPFATAQLLNRLAQQPQLLLILRVQPGLPCRLHRPWLSLSLHRRERTPTICDHYAILLQKLPPAVATGYLSPTGVTLATLDGRDERRFSVRLLADANLDKEGEATLRFCDEQEATLAELTFTLCRQHDRQVLFIGGLQGGKAWLPHDAIQSATKACHGLFPKRLLVETAMALGELLDVSQIRAVSNRTHIYRSLRYRKKKQGLLHADYDSFWHSLGGSPNASGDFVLPLALPRKAMEEIASKKRAEYRRRYELLDSLQQQTALRCRR